MRLQRHSGGKNSKLKIVKMALPHICLSTNNIFQFYFPGFSWISVHCSSVSFIKASSFWADIFPRNVRQSSRFHVSDLRKFLRLFIVCLLTEPPERRVPLKRSRLDLNIFALSAAITIIYQHLVLINQFCWFYQAKYLSNYNKHTDKYEALSQIKQINK